MMCEKGIQNHTQRYGFDIDLITDYKKTNIKYTAELKVIRRKKKRKREKKITKGNKQKENNKDRFKH